MDFNGIAGAGEDRRGVLPSLLIGWIPGFIIGLVALLPPNPVNSSISSGFDISDPVTSPMIAPF